MNKDELKDHRDKLLGKADRARYNLGGSLSVQNYIEMRRDLADLIHAIYAAESVDDIIKWTHDSEDIKRAESLQPREGDPARSQEEGEKAEQKVEAFAKKLAPLIGKHPFPNKDIPPPLNSAEALKALQANLKYATITGVYTGTIALHTRPGVHSKQLCIEEAQELSQKTKHDVELHFHCGLGSPLSTEKSIHIGFKA